MDVEAIFKDSGLSSAELSRRLEVSDGHIADLKSGRRHLTIPLAAKVEEVLGRSGIVAAVVAERTSVRSSAG